MSCPICSSSDHIPIFRKDAMPCYNLERHSSRTSALAARTGTLDSRFCNVCGFTFNAAFEAEKMNYQVDYENSRSHSRHYRAYLEHIAELLVSHIPSRATNIVEVGCGGGEFLTALKRRTNATLWGFDPAIPPEVEESPGIRLIRDYYRKETAPVQFGMLILRHTLEHIQDPYAFFELLLPSSERPVLYIEVPAWEWIVERQSFYAFSYEHCSYYSRRALTCMLARIGYEVRSCEFDFDNEYIRCIAYPSGTATEVFSMGNLVEQSGRFSAALPSIMTRMRSMFSPESILWGAAGKGTTLINLTDIMYTDSPVVVDSNPRRTHTYIPRTGQEVISPDSLRRIGPKRILLTNSAYRSEIEKTLAESSLALEIVGLDEYLYRSTA